MKKYNGKYIFQNMVHIKTFIQMKKTIYNIAMLALIVFVMPSCSDFLDEDPKSQLSTAYLETDEGVEEAVNAAYSSLRYFYTGGQSDAVIRYTAYGTDEWQRAQDGSEIIDQYKADLLSAGLNMAWDWGYEQGINPCNAIVQFAEQSTSMSENVKKDVVAQAKFIRAFWYFILVQTYGEVTLTLELAKDAKTTASRNTYKELYDAILEDVSYAVDNLKLTSQPNGSKATKAAALHLRSKVYLAKATNEAVKEDSDYQNAYDDAMDIINNQAEYGLAIQPDFFEMFYPRNEYNEETIFLVDRNADPLYNNAKDDDFRGNFASFYYRPNYSALVPGLERSTDYYYGRPWHRVRPTNYLLEHVFAERESDTRYNSTFQTVWHMNDADAIDDPNFQVGDIAIWLPGVESGYDASVKAKAIFTPSQYFENEKNDGESIYPSLNKFNDIDRPSIPDPSVRPLVVYRLAETYLNAAEAAMYLGKADEAKDLVAVVRRRAAYSPDKASDKIALDALRLVAGIPVLDASDNARNWLLDERMRELAGEFVRWYDLKRSVTEDGTNQLLARVNDHLPTVGYPVPASGNVKEFHILRPIPVTQIDLTTGEPYPQNPGY